MRQFCDALNEKIGTAYEDAKIAMTALAFDPEFTPIAPPLK